MVGPATRQTGRLIIAVAAIMVLTATGAVETDTLPTVGLRLTGGVTRLDMVLALTLLFGTFGFILRLVADLEGVVRRAAEKELDRLRTLNQEPPSTQVGVARTHERAAGQSPGNVAPLTGRRQELLRRSAQLVAELDRLRQLGESGSRFSRFASERVVAESELLAVSNELAALSDEAAAEAPAEESRPTRDAARVSAVRRLGELQELEDAWASSSLVVLSRSSRIALDLVLAPCLAALAILVWGISI